MWQSGFCVWEKERRCFLIIIDFRGVNSKKYIRFYLDMYIKRHSHGFDQVLET